MTALLDGALAYATRGRHVFPLRPGGKLPLTPNGLHDATVDAETIRAWWARWPNANIGLRTGDGLVVVDVDELSAWTALLELVQAPTPETARVVTARGWHLWFETSDEIRNSAGRVAPGIDVRGAGGYVVAPPSLHETGHVYAFENGTELSPLPSWLRDRIVGASRETNGAAPRLPVAPGAGTAYGRRALEAEAEIVASAVEGTRNDRLNTAALKLGQLVAGGELDEHEVRAVLLDAALSAGLTEREATATLDSGIGAGKEQPRRAPEPEHLSRNGTAPAAAASENGGRRLPAPLIATPLATIKMRSIEWLEKPLWQQSAFQLLSGAKGAGKGTYLAGLAARISRAGSNVVFVSTEDSAEIDLKPRLVAAGADIDRCSIIQQHVRLPDDVDELRLLAHGLGGVGLFVVDPVANHIGVRNSNSDAEVRDAIAPLNQLADDLACLLIGVRHPGKDRSRGAVASILGSTAWVDTPRAVVMIAVDDEDPLVRHIQVVVGNRSLNGAAQAFRIDAVDVPGLTEPITLAVPLGESAKSVDELLSAEKPTSRVSGVQLQALILRELDTGEKSREYLNAVAKDELGASADSVYQTGLEPLRKAGRVKPQKAGLAGGWYWHHTEERF